MPSFRITYVFDPGPIEAATFTAWSESTAVATVVAKSKAPFDPTSDGQPHLKDQIFGRVVGPLASMLWSPTPYAAFVEMGTGPHEIRPRSASALRFQSGGETVFAKVVHHPGTSVQPFLQPAADLFVTEIFPTAFARAVNSSAGGALGAA